MLKIAVAVKFYKGEISPFDASALEWALSEKNAEVTVISMSPITMTPQAEYITRLGADFILVSDKALIGSDTLVTSKVLDETIKSISPDIVYCGRQSVDGAGTCGDIRTHRVRFYSVRHGKDGKHRKNKVRRKGNNG